MEPARAKIYEECVQYTREILDLEKQIETSLSSLFHSKILPSASHVMINRLEAMVKLLDQDLDKLQEYEETIKPTKEQTTFQNGAIKTAKEAVSKIAAYREQLKELPEGASTEDPLEQGVTIHLESSPPSLSEEEISDLQDSFNALQDDYLELAQEILAEENLEALPSEKKAEYFAFWQYKEEIDHLNKYIFLLPSEKLNLLNDLTKAIQRIEQAGFLEAYRHVDALQKKCAKDISSESSFKVDMYFKKLISNSTQLDHLLKVHLHQGRSIDSFLAALPTEELKLTFYCIAKYQDELQELAASMKAGDVARKDIPPHAITLLAEIAALTVPLKTYFTPKASALIPTCSEVFSLEEASAFQQKAVEKLEGMQTAESTTEIHELLWRASLGFIQNGRQDLAHACLTLATKNHLLLSTDLFSLRSALANNQQHGVYLSGVGTSYNKEQAVHLTECRIDAAPTLTMDFELTGHGVAGLKETVSLNDPHKIKERLPVGFCSEIQISAKSEHFYREFNNGAFDSAAPGYRMPDTPQTVYDFKGVGKVTIGNCPGVKCIGSQIYIEATPKGSLEETLSNISVMLTALGVPPILVQSRTEDLQRKALFHVFRSFFPREAALFERDASHFQLSVESLAEKMIQIKPSMHALVQEHLNADFLPKQEIETISKKTVTRVNLSERMQEKGALGLMAGMEGSVELRAPLISRMVRPGGLGMISSQLRFMKGIISVGQSSYSDHKEGGASGVFTRLITKELAAKKQIDDMPFHGSMQFLIDLKAVNKPNTYGFESDCYGTRAGGAYFSRLNLMELTEALQRPREELFGKPGTLEKYGTANEVVVRDSIPPEDIIGICVRTEAEKQILIRQFQADGILTTQNGQLYLGLTPITDYIKVAEKFTEEMWHG